MTDLMITISSDSISQQGPVNGEFQTNDNPSNIDITKEYIEGEDREMEPMSRAAREVLQKVDLSSISQQGPVNGEFQTNDNPSNIDITKVYIEGEDLESGTMSQEAPEISQKLDLKKPKHVRIARDFWAQKLTNLESRRRVNMTDVNNNTVVTYQIVGFYVVFQITLFTSVAQATNLRCGNWWIPFTLSVLTSLVTSLAIFQNMRRYLVPSKSKFKLDTDVRAANRELQRIALKGTTFDIMKVSKDGLPKRRLFHRNFPANLYVVVLILSLLTFSVMFSYGIYLILCHPGP